MQLQQSILASSRIADTLTLEKKALRGGFYETLQ